MSAIAVAPRAIARDVRDVPWWHELQVPDPPSRTLLLQNVQATPASEFDPKLPAIPLDVWLWLTLSPAVEVPRSTLVDWTLTFCLDRERPGPGPELCADGTVRLSADRNIRLVITIAAADRSTKQWRPTRPSLRDVYIERVKELTRIDSFDVPALGALPDLLNTPFEQWPTVDFESTITWSPQKPAPGDTVRFSISIKNTSTRSARASVDILITPCCQNVPVREEFRHEWFPQVPAGQSVRVEVAVPFPGGMGSAIVSVKPWQGDKRVRESNRDKVMTSVLVGYPPRPSSKP